MLCRIAGFHGRASRRLLYRLRLIPGSAEAGLSPKRTPHARIAGKRVWRGRHCPEPGSPSSIDISEASVRSVGNTQSCYKDRWRHHPVSRWLVSYIPLKQEFWSDVRSGSHSSFSKTSVARGFGAESRPPRRSQCKEGFPEKSTGVVVSSVLRICFPCKENDPSCHSSPRPVGRQG